jgi:recombinational DNA repair protein RecR
MQLPSTLLENAVAEFAKLPGIGKKTALRLVLHLLKQEQDVTNNFSEVLKKNAQGNSILSKMLQYQRWNYLFYMREFW